VTAIRVAALAALFGVTLAAATQASLVDRLAGRYNHHFTNGTVFGESYPSDDVLEIVRLDRRRAYFRARVNFFNGHSCAIRGVAHLEGNALVYRGTDAPFSAGSRCVMRFRPVGGGLDLDDGGGSCQQTCGARGTYMGNGPEFAMSSRRPIAYLARLRASREYRDAIAEDARRH
jgi:hypothetical protein